MIFLLLYENFSVFSAKIYLYVVGIYKKDLGKAILMSTHNVSLSGETRKKK